MDRSRETTLGVLRSSAARRTVALGQLLGGLLEAEDVIGLVGDLGAGKTCFAQGIALGLAVDAGYRVASPTFTLINEYPARAPFVHIDLYRLDDAEELREVGVFDYLGGPQVCVVEWFDRLVEETPAEFMRVSILAEGARRRRFEVAAAGARHEAVARRWLELASA